MPLMVVALISALNDPTPTAPKTSTVPVSPCANTSRLKIARRPTAAPKRPGPGGRSGRSIGPAGRPADSQPWEAAAAVVEARVVEAALIPRQEAARGQGDLGALLCSRLQASRRPHRQPVSRGCPCRAAG